MQSDRLWRVLFGVGGVIMAAGGPLHPRDDTMHAMLINPSWFASHMAQLVGFGLMTLGMMRFRRVMTHSPAVQRWSGLAALGLALQTVEMAFHLASMVDAENLAAGLATPVLSTHLFLAVTIYPLLAILMGGLIVVPRALANLVMCGSRRWALRAWWPRHWLWCWWSASTCKRHASVSRWSCCSPCGPLR